VSGTLGFSFGYIVTAATERPGGGREITKLDVFEITATTAPMNNGTRVLSTKGLDELDRVRTKARERHARAAERHTRARND
jgi:hypothetical protein